MARLARSAWDATPAWLANLVLAAAYFGTAKLGLSLAFRTSSVTAVWPPTGIALVAVFLGGYRLTPGIALGALLANATTGHLPPGSVVLIATGNTLEALGGAYLLRRAGFAPSLERLRDVIAVAVLAGGVSTAIAATIGTTSLLAGSKIDAADYGVVWRTWWLGDMGGDLLVAPALFVLFRNSRWRQLPGGAVEAISVTAALAAVTFLAFSVSAPVLYVVFPGLVWGALRYWQPGAAAASLLVAGIAVARTANGHGPLVRADEDASLLLAQTFVSFAGVTAYLLAAAATERRQVEETVEFIAETLQESLLPAQPPPIPGIDIAAHFRPAGRATQVGGDFYDVFQLSEGSWGVVIGDVCGKGPRAAAVTGLARHTVRAAAHYERSPSRVLGVLNEAVLVDPSADDYCTASYVRLDLDGDGSARLTVSNAGHPLPLVLRAGGDVGTAGRPGTLLGVTGEPRLFDDELRLAPGDMLLLYTDGLTEAYAPRRVVEPSELAADLAACAGHGAADVLDALTGRLLAERLGEPRDDVALLALRLMPRGES